MVWQEGQRWRAKVRDNNGKRISRWFDTKARAVQWIAQVEQNRGVN